jgi:tetratricopeptide (TPR) repeat protein
MKFRNLALAAGGLLVFAFASLAQVTAIEGDAKGADGQPLLQAVVNIERIDIKGHYTTKTDKKKGHYIYTGLPIGTYNISLVVDGKEVDSVKNVKTHPGDPIRYDFNLKAAKAENSNKQQMYQKALETGEVSADLKRQLSPEQLEQLKKDMEKKEAGMKKNAALNSAYNDGLAALNAKDYDKAIENLNKAAEIDPTQIAVFSNLATAYTELAKTKTGADFDGNMQKALDVYGKALALKPEDPGIHNNFALTLARAKKFPEAQAELQKAAELDPQNAGKYYYNLGALLVNAGQNEPAGNAFKKAIELQPTYADAYYQYGVTLVAKAQTSADGKVTPVPGTIEAFQKYIELQPTGPYAQPSKDMLAMLGSTVDTSYKNPNDSSNKKKTKK